MSEKTPEKPVDAVAAESSSKPSGAESPRTAKELDFDDDVHDALPVPVPDRQPTPKGTKRVSFQDDETQAPPPKPPRPLNPQAHAEATLIEAFPSIDTKVVKAVLAASGGKVEPAFNALLGMSDPNYEQDMAPPPVPRKAQPMSQLEADELYARQLAEQYNTSYTGFGGRGVGNPPVPARKQDTGLKPNEMHGQKEHSFFDDDLPEITKNIQQGFETTKTTINKWFTDFQRKLDGDESNDPIPRPGGSQQQQQYRRQDFGPSQSNQLYGIQKSAETRRSADRDRYDHDPQVLGDDFAHRLELRDDEAPPAKPPRPLANPELFRSGGEGSTPTSTLKTAPGRQPSPASGTGKTGGKWQPLTSVEPKSDLQDHDPFSLGDSDEEPESAKKDTKPTEAATATTPPVAAAVKEPEATSSSDKKEEEKGKVEAKG